MEGEEGASSHHAIETELRGRPQLLRKEDEARTWVRFVNERWLLSTVKQWRHCQATTPMIWHSA